MVSIFFTKSDLACRNRNVLKSPIIGREQRDYKYKVDFVVDTMTVSDVPEQFIFMDVF